MIETCCASAISPSVSALSSTGVILLFLAGLLYTDSSKEVTTDNVPGDALWIIGGLLLAVGFAIDAIQHFRKSLNLLVISKLFGVAASLMCTNVGFIGPFERKSTYDYFVLRNCIFSASIFFLVHVITLVLGQHIDVTFKVRE